MNHPGYVALFGDAATAGAFAVYRHHPGHVQLPDGSLRAIDPDLPIAVTLDLHCNLTEKMVIARYSHVTHIVSNVTG